MVDVGSAPTRVENNVLRGNSNAGLALTIPSHRVRGNRLEENCAPSWSCAQIVFFPVRQNGGAEVLENRLSAGPGQKLVLRLANSKFDPAPASFDRNAYAAADPKPFCWSDLWTCQEWLSFAEWQKLGHDARSSFTRRIH